jgi:uncharacterized protein (TIGR02996 family)
MPDRDALLSAIRANPDDDAPRLAFADWLDENEPDKKRKKEAPPSSWAALIRAECELAQLQADGSAAAAVHDSCDTQLLESVRWDQRFPEMARRVELHRQIVDLRSRSAKARRVGLPKAAGNGIKWREAGWYDETDRGFPGSVTIQNWRKFVAALPWLVDACPPVALSFADNIMPEDGKEAVDRGFAKWCQSLDLDVYDDYSADLVVAMSASPETTGVRKLRLACGYEEPATRAVTAIADSPNWSGLRELALDCINAKLPEALTERLFRAPHLRGLKRVSIQGETTLPATKVLTELPELRELGFDFQNLDDAAACGIADSPNVKGLRSLRASCAQLTGAGLAALLKSPNLTGLAVLSLTLADLRKMPKGVLANAPTGGLRMVSLARCQTEEGAVALAKSPRLSEVVSFDAGTDLDAKHVLAMIAAFGDHPPAALTMHSAKLELDDVKALANWPGAAQLDVLDLWRVMLKNNTAKALAQSPYLKNLRHLHYTPATPAADAIIKAAFGDRAAYRVLY